MSHIVGWDSIHFEKQCIEALLPLLMAIDVFKEEMCPSN
jgi:hypothetical protein